jgi:methylmalonyl-CoA/ethylmalonyl-CoA epimerase
MLSNLKFHHIGYAVSDIFATAEYYINAGWKMTDIQTDEIQNTKIAFLSKNEMPLIELIAPVDDTSPIVKTLDKIGVTPYHVCYEVTNIEQSILELRKQHFIALFRPALAVALNNRKICYLYNKHVGLIELLESN